MKLVTPALFALLIWGCQSTQEPVTSKPDKTEAPVAEATNKTPSQPEATAVALPDDLKNDAYHYTAVNHGKPLTYTVKSSMQAEPQEGTQTMTITSVENGVVKIDVKRTGGLDTLLGSESMELRKDGIYTVTNTKVRPKEPTLELPDSLKSGKSWDSNTSMETDGGEMKQVAKYTVVGSESVKTPAGTFEAQKITSLGTIEYNGQKVTMNATMWYAKDLGLVKMKAETKSKDASSSMELELKSK